MNSITPRCDLPPAALTGAADPRLPTRASGLLFAAKATALRLKRGCSDLAGRLPRLSTAAADTYPVLLAELITPLWADARLSETRYQFGKVQNLRRAAAALDRLALPAGATFSFWRQLGRPSRGRGFADGRMLKEGCLVPSTGGGLCQISNALYDVALQAGADILERHPHSRAVPGSVAAFGRDATVAWNYIDLRFRAPQDALLRVTLDAATLTVRLFGRGAACAAAVSSCPDAFAALRRAAHDCGSCGETRCYRHERTGRTVGGRTAFLVDEAWPEFRAYVAERRSAADLIAMALDGRRWNRPRYAWDTGGFARTITATGTSLLHGLLARRANRPNSSQGTRVAAQLRRAEAVARRLGAALAPDVTEVVVAQSLLPFLWRAGALGGRRLTVLMTRLPMAELQARLDEAAAQHPESTTLADFRAPAALVAAETEALAAAQRIVTPHAGIAALFPGRAELLDWRMPVAPAAGRRISRRCIAFPGPSLARKGAHAVREAVLRLDLELVLLGGALEGEGFWHGLPVRPAAADWRDQVAAVVQPALIEEQPRRLLEALAAGIPVIATPACGIGPRPGLTLVPEGDPAALTHALTGLLQDLSVDRIWDDKHSCHRSAGQAS